MDSAREALEPAGETPVGAVWPADGPWSIRLTVSHGGRPALEVYEHGLLIDVLVASTLSGELLRGTRRSTAGLPPGGLAWGRVAEGGEVPVVDFTSGWLRPSRRAAEVLKVDGGFWLAWAPGPIAEAVVHRADGRTERLRPGRPN
ncbi:hypothetical protein OG455_26955 [Kitasatospora sp. NBC_01287]|uniref:hypothetical protein n=1 Tax=Kitasatospora sp. NBC_01287 TaxID=2903573 RepID=UPI0022553A07|nr:hypothetical protein [Kitasatospora sp. NBC_01287]MCX4749105.1 hypothetical protein [Kitasatospora sp. NBC_01287]